MIGPAVPKGVRSDPEGFASFLSCRRICQN